MDPANNESQVEGANEPKVIHGNILEQTLEELETAPSRTSDLENFELVR